MAMEAVAGANRACAVSLQCSGHLRWSICKRSTVFARWRVDPLLSAVTIYCRSAFGHVRLGADRTNFRWYLADGLLLFLFTRAADAPGTRKRRLHSGRNHCDLRHHYQLCDVCQETI